MGCVHSHMHTSISISICKGQLVSRYLTTFSALLASVALAASTVSSSLLNEGPFFYEIFPKKFHVCSLISFGVKGYNFKAKDSSASVRFFWLD